MKYSIQHAFYFCIDCRVSQNAWGDVLYKPLLSWLLYVFSYQNISKQQAIQNRSQAFSPNLKGHVLSSHAKIQGCHFSNFRCRFVCSCFCMPPWTSRTFKMIQCKPRKAGEELSAWGSSQSQGSFIKEEHSFRCCACKCGLFQLSTWCVQIKSCGVQLWHINITPGDAISVDQMCDVPHPKQVWRSLLPSSNSLQIFEGHTGIRILWNWTQLQSQAHWMVSPSRRCRQPVQAAKEQAESCLHKEVLSVCANRWDLTAQLEASAGKWGWRERSCQHFTGVAPNVTLKKDEWFR